MFREVIYIHKLNLKKIWIVYSAIIMILNLSYLINNYEKYSWNCIIISMTFISILFVFLVFLVSGKTITSIEYIPENRELNITFKNLFSKVYKIKLKVSDLTYKFIEPPIQRGSSKQLILLEKGQGIGKIPIFGIREMADKCDFLIKRLTEIKNDLK